MTETFNICYLITSYNYIPLLTLYFLTDPGIVIQYLLKSLNYKKKTCQNWKIK